MPRPSTPAKRPRKPAKPAVKRPPGQPSRFTPEKATAFCAVLADCCNVGRACRAIGISRTAVYEWRETHPEFGKLWEVALKVGVSALEDEAHRRAFEGVDKPITHLGMITATVKEYSDTLAIFLLKAHAPEKYRERVETAVTGNLSFTVVTGIPDVEGH
jgi:transposase-like protein